MNGVVRPPYKPNSDQPIRDTNRLRYLARIVRGVIQLKLARNFVEPVDAVALRIPVRSLERFIASRGIFDGSVMVLTGVCLIT